MCVMKGMYRYCLQDKSIRNFRKNEMQIYLALVFFDTSKNLIPIDLVDCNYCD